MLLLPPLQRLLLRLLLSLQHLLSLLCQSLYRLLSAADADRGAHRLPHPSLTTLAWWRS